MSKTTPRCFTEGGPGRYKLCLKDSECLISPRPDQEGCLGEIACEQLLSFEGPPYEEVVLEKTIAIYDGKNAFLLSRGEKVSVVRYESHMLSTYVVTGDEVKEGTLIAGKLSRKGTFRKERSQVEGTIILVTADPLGRVDRHLIIIDTMGVHRKIDCELRHE